MIFSTVEVDIKQRIKKKLFSIDTSSGLTQRNSLLFPLQCTFKGPFLGFFLPTEWTPFILWCIHDKQMTRENVCQISIFGQSIIHLGVRPLGFGHLCEWPAPYNRNYFNSIAYHKKTNLIYILSYIFVKKYHNGI